MMETALDRFFKLERDKYGKAEYRFKEEYFHEKLIAFYIRPFNPTYLYQYTTTEYPHTYFPGRKRGDEESMLATEYHENVHKWDRWKQGFRFTLGYAFPQIVAAPFILAVVAVAGLWGWLGLGALLLAFHAGLAALALSVGKGVPDDNYAGAIPSRGARVAFYVLTAAGGLACVAGTIIGGGFLSLLWLPAALFLSPWPIKARWRRDAELRGYTASLYRVWLRYRAQWNQGWCHELIAHYVKAFTGPAYFFMETDGNYVEQEFVFQTARFQANNKSFLANWGWLREAGHVDKEAAEPFRMMHDFMVSEGTIDGQD